MLNFIINKNKYDFPSQHRFLQIERILYFLLDNISDKLFKLQINVRNFGLYVLIRIFKQEYQNFEFDLLL